MGLRWSKSEFLRQQHSLFTRRQLTYLQMDTHALKQRLSMADAELLIKDHTQESPRPFDGVVCHMQDFRQSFLACREAYVAAEVACTGMNITLQECISPQASKEPTS